MGQHKLPKPPKQHFDVRAEKKKYSIAFQTTKIGVLQSVDVTIEVGTLMDDEVTDVSLVDHPLYRELWRYCKNNPPTGS